MPSQIGALIFDPAHNYIDYVIHLVFRQGATFWDFMPFLQAASTTTCASMLRDENRMAAHGCLFAVISWLRHRQAGIYKIVGMTINLFHADTIDILNIFWF